MISIVNNQALVEMIIFINTQNNIKILQKYFCIIILNFYCNEFSNLKFYYIFLIYFLQLYFAKVKILKYLKV